MTDGGAGKETWMKFSDEVSGMNIFVKGEPLEGEPRKMAFQWGEWDFIEVWFNNDSIERCEMWGTKEGFSNLPKGEGGVFARDLRRYLKVASVVEKEKALASGARLVLYDNSAPITTKGLEVLEGVMGRVGVL